MSFTLGRNVKVTLFGQSHAECVGCTIEGLAPGTPIDTEALQAFMKRRQGGTSCTTPRKEADVPQFIAGIGPDNTLCEGPLVAVIPNQNKDSKPYERTRHIPRPSHADLVSYLAYDQHEDWRGGGSFSARLTAGLCIAGALAKQILQKQNIKVAAHLLQVGDVYDEAFYTGIDVNHKVDTSIIPSSNPNLEVQLKSLETSSFPCINEDAALKMQELISKVGSQGDSIGAAVECVVQSLPIGLGQPFFDGIDAQLARAIFSLPAVKSFEMGAGKKCVEARGSEFNDQMRYVNGEIEFLSNNSGGTLGGLTTSAPLVFNAGFKPTPTISIEQKTINLETKENLTYSFEGRHDPCVGVRAVAVIEAMTSIVILDNLMEFQKSREVQP